MIKKLRIKNFKSIEDSKDIEIMPITIFVGPNSSGKTSLFLPLCLLKNTIESRDQENPLIFSGDPTIDIASYKDLIFKNDIEKDFHIEINIVTDRPFPSIFGIPIPEGKSIKNMEFKYNLILGYNKEKEEIKIKYYGIHKIGSKGSISGKKSIRFELKLTNEKEQEFIITGITGVNKKKDKVETATLKTADIKLNKFYKFSIYTHKRKINSNFENLMKLSLMNNLFSILIEEEFINLYHIAPVREYPQRSYIITGTTPKDVGIKGEYTSSVLAIFEKEKTKRLIKELIKWLNKLGIAKDLKVDKFFEEYYRLLISGKVFDFKSNIAYVGFGVSQVMPILVQCIYSPKGSTIIIEQPEIHLHPKLQSKLADFLLNISKQDKSLIIETHSEHIISRIQRRIAEKKISNKEVAIYYFKMTKDGTKIKRLKLNEFGQFEYWPRGFFEEKLADALAHIKALNIKNDKNK